MREIKFRIWNVNTGRMADWDEVRHEYSFTMLAHESVIAEQFTGLLDKNGVEIYEGDILSWPSHLVNRKRGQCDRGVIEYSPEHLEYYLTNINGSGAFTGTVNLYAGKDVVGEVIGNIHQNPDLL